MKTSNPIGILWFCCDILSLRNVMEYMKLIILPAFLEGVVCDPAHADDNQQTMKNW